MADENRKYQPPETDGPTRRAFLAASAGLGAAAMFGGWPLWAEDLATLPAPGQPAGKLLGVVPFTKTEGLTFGELTGQGMEGRRLYDLSTLSNKTLVTATDRFFVRTRAPEGLPPQKDWKMRVRLYDGGPSLVGLDWLAQRERDLGVHLLEGTSNRRSNGFGAISAARWGGVPVTDMLEGYEERPDLYGLLISGYDRHPRMVAGQQAGASWIFSFDQLRKTGAFLATQMNGQPLSKDQGAPVRLVVPGWFGCCSIKWVQDIVAVGLDVTSTPHMREYASRVNARGKPRLARFYPPAEVEFSGVPVRVERWRVQGEIVHRIVGIVWGGPKPVEELAIRVISEDFKGSTTMVPQPITDYTAPANTKSWALWSHTLKLPKPGTYRINLTIPDRSVRARRILRGIFLRRFIAEAS